MKLELNSAAERFFDKSILHSGLNVTGLPYISIYLSNKGTINMPKTNSTYIYYVANGILRLHTPSGIMDYEKGQYSVSAIDTPDVGYVLVPNAEEPFIAISLEFNPSDVIEIILMLDDKLIEQISNGLLKEEDMDSADKEVSVGIFRLLEVSHDSVKRQYLGNSIRKEILFNVLCGSNGANFLKSIIAIQNSSEIYSANEWIKNNYKQDFTVEKLAKKFNMSVSVFHEKFKIAVGMTPLQCQKRLRLTEARRLMMDEERSVSETAEEVGYDNLSQFIREYKKMFGMSPKEDIKRIRTISEK